MNVCTYSVLFVCVGGVVLICVFFREVLGLLVCLSTKQLPIR